MVDVLRLPVAAVALVAILEEGQALEIDFSKGALQLELGQHRCMPLLGRDGQPIVEDECIERDMPAIAASQQQTVAAAHRRAFVHDQQLGARIIGFGMPVILDKPSSMTCCSVRYGCCEDPSPLADPLTGSMT